MRTTEKHRWKALGLVSATVLCLMASTIISTQSSDASWLIEGKEIAFNEQLDVGAHTGFNLWVEKETNLEILCSVIEENFLSLLKGTTEASGKLEFRLCETFQNKTLQSNCPPVEPIVATVKAHLILHSGKNYILVEPEFPGAILAVVKFKETCGLPPKNNLKGTVVANA